jgi:uncharacterized protein YecT (DUF1311 family)
LALAPAIAASAPAAKSAPAARKAPAKKAPAAKRPAKATPEAAPVISAPPPDPTRWVGDAGLPSAKSVIATCLEGPRPETCAHTAFLQCDRESGEQGQQTMNTCAGFARAAWDARITGVVERLQALITKTGRTRPTPRSLASSQRRWQGWSEDDCDMQTEGSRDGVLHPMEVDLCLSDHAAARTRELEQLERIWSR